jgi:hypothetical protein
MSDQRSQREIEEQLFALIDGTACEAEAAAVEQRLLADPSAQAEYLAWMEMQSILEWEHGQLTDKGGSLPIAWPTELGGGAAEGPKAGNSWLFPGLLGFLTFSLIVTLILLFAREYPPAPSTIVAHLTDMSEARWPAGVAAPAIGAPLGPGLVRLEAGTVQIAFSSGAVAALTGPAELDLITPKRVFLRRGLMSPYVPPSARGFTVLAPEGQVVDLGTQFALRVEGGGHTHLHVIDGTVQVASDATADGAAKDLTTGYSARMEASAPARITQVPLLIDTFAAAGAAELNAGLRQRQAGIGAPLGYLDLDPDAPAEIRGGKLAMPFEGRKGRECAVSRVMLNHDFSDLIGHRYTISYKVKLPAIGSLGAEHWVGFVLEERRGGRTSPWAPPAYEPEVNFCVLIHPQWQAGAQVGGTPRRGPQRVFAQADAAGPYQVVVRVDETVPGSPRLDLDVNGIPILAHTPLSLGAGRFLGFQTFVTPHSGVHGWGYVYDLCLSVDSDVVRQPGRADSIKPSDSRADRPRG